MYLNYDIKKIFNLFIDIFKDYKIIYIFILCSIIFGIILFINKENKKSKYLIFTINIILIGFIIYFYNINLFSNIFIHFNHNIYFYFLNTIIYLIIIIISFFKLNNFKKIIIPFYSISLIFLLFSLFMTSYLKNIHLIVIGNIFPMIVFGNYLYFIFYIIILFNIIKNKVQVES